MEDLLVLSSLGRRADSWTELAFHLAAGLATVALIGVVLGVPWIGAGLLLSAGQVTIFLVRRRRRRAVD
jgi:hypothetical protein